MDVKERRKGEELATNRGGRKLNSAQICSSKLGLSHELLASNIVTHAEGTRGFRIFRISVCLMRNKPLF